MLFLFIKVVIAKILMLMMLLTISNDQLQYQPDFPAFFHVVEQKKRKTCH